MTDRHEDDDLDENTPETGPYRRAVTMGVKYETEPHPKLPWVTPKGWIAVEAPDMETWYEFVVAIFGRSESGGVQYAFDYDLDEFENDPEHVRHYPAGRIAEFSCRPIRVGLHLEREG